MTERFNTLVQVVNEFTIGDDGWAQLAPFGDHPGVALTPDGPRTVIQRVDQDAGVALRKSLLSFTGRASRFFRSVPIFNGHPDVRAMAAKYPDRSPKGYIGDLQVRADGIYVLPILNEDGAALINGERRLGLSAYVAAEMQPVADGQTPVARWTQLHSAGLTDRPNLPVELLNSKTDTETMTPKLIAALAAVGITLANEATEEQILLGITNLANARDQALADAKSKADALAATTAERDTARTDLANERAARITDELGAAVEAGRIPEADRGLWQKRLEVGFANEVIALRKLEPTLKTRGTLANSGDRRAQAGERSTVELINEAVGEIRKGNPDLTFQTAYAQVVREKPELFAAAQ